MNATRDDVAAHHADRVPVRRRGLLQYQRFCVLDVHRGPCYDVPMQTRSPLRVPCARMNHHLDNMAEFMLMLPALMWVANWIIWPISLPLCLGMVYIYLYHCRERMAYAAKDRDDAGSRNITVMGIAVCLAVAAGITFLNGFDGRIMQTPDFQVRNAVYGELISSPWPLILDDGSFVTYAIQYWIPPALLASYLPEWKTPILQGWFFIGLLVIWLQLLKYMAWRKTLLLAVCLLLASPISFFLYPELSVLNVIPNVISDCTCTYHFYVMGMLMITLYLSQHTSYRQLLFAATLLFVCAPLTAAFFAPLMLWRTWQVLRGDGQESVLQGMRRLLSLPEFYVCLGLIGCQFAYSSSSTGAYVSYPWVEMAGKVDIVGIVYKIVMAVLLIAVPALVAYRITGEKILIYSGCFSSMCVLVCITGDGHINELLFKSSTAYCFFLIFCLVKHIHRPVAGSYLLLILCFSLLPMWHYCFETKQLNEAIRHGFAVRQENIVDPWGSRMYRPNERFYERLVSHGVNMPWLFQRSDCIGKKTKDESSPQPEN